MTQYTNDLSNLSYTNKDFGAIYPELLDVVRKLSEKWDPQESNESDPGVVLLKLNALMADKLNYNIDKNILELFPSSVTQYSNAREIFEQCGYNMHHYIGATTDVTFVLKTMPDPSQEGIEYTANTVFKIPQFTMVTNADNTVVYTTTQEAALKENFPESVQAIEGTIHTYLINGYETVTLADIDYNNRLYFPSLNVAQNGIFIQNNKYGYADWVPVDNLEVQKLGTPCYKFGVNKTGSRCYIEFPSDIHNLIGKGLTIKYIKTNGTSGNINQKVLTKFYTEVNSTSDATTSDGTSDVVKLTTDNVSILNPFATTSGKDPETIESANRNYQRIKTTFDTLVSLRDYNNFLVTSKAVSNGYVTDRLTDPQSSYVIMEKHGDVQTPHNKIKTHSRTLKDANGESIDNSVFDEYGNDLSIVDDMTAFDLKLYGFQYVNVPQTESQFNRSYSVIPNLNATDISYGLAAQWEELNDIKCVQHNFASYKTNVPFMFKNKYPIIAKVIPSHKLDSTSKSEVLRNVRLALYVALNSSQLTFGTAIDYSMLYDLILTADPRIKSVVLNDIVYETYAVYLNTYGEVEESRIDDGVGSSVSELVQGIRDDIVYRSILAGVTPLFVPRNKFVYKLTQQCGNIIENCTSVSTSTCIPNTEGVFNVIENEQVRLACPNIITEETYGNYVKYIYSNSGSDDTIDAGSETVLLENAFILFLWKTDDNEATPYTYHIYTRESPNGANIVCPNINIESNISSDLITEALKEAINTAVASASTKVHGTFDKSLNEVIKKLIGNNFVLSGTNSITIKKINQVTLSSSKSNTRYLAWILRDDPTTLFQSGQDSRELKPGEYLLYTNKDKTSLLTFGEGTIIKRDAKNTKSSLANTMMASLTSESILDYGTEAVDKYWMLPPYDITVEEQQILLLGEGSELTISDTNSGDTLTGAETAVFNRTIKYKTTDVETEQILPVRTTEATAWKIKACLNIDTAIDKPQRLDKDHKHTVTFTSLQGSTPTSHALTASTEDNTSRYFATTETIVLEGSEDAQNITLQKFVNEYETVDVTVDVYSYIESDQNDTQLSDSDKIELDESNDYTSTSTITLPQGDYLFSVQPRTEANITINLSYTEDIAITDVTSPDNSLDSYTLKNNSENWFILTVEEDPTPDTSITLTASDATKQVNCIVSSFVVLDSAEVTNIKKTIATLITNYDTERKFNYGYVNTDETMIDTPLKAASFFDPSHIMNKFTIAQWDTAQQLKQILVEDRVK